MTQELREHVTALPEQVAQVELKAKLFRRFHAGLSHQIPGPPDMIKAALQPYTRQARSPEECRSSRPRKTGQPQDIVYLRLMPLLVECDNAYNCSTLLTPISGCWCIIAW
ncbi:MAG: hypothetical protein ACRERE_15405 [Candidatus Entotheonellia bacterium]